MSQPLTFAERIELGQQQRQHMKRAEHAGWDAKLRKDDPLKLLKKSDEGRAPSLVKMKYQRMAVSPFTFFRGAASVMAYDLSLGQNTAIVNQICGDAHVNNLGAYDGADGRIGFDINDFDETIVAPFEWDVKRMATSVILAAQDAGAKDARCRDAAATMLESYRASIVSASKMAFLDVARREVRRLADVPAIADVLQSAKRATPAHTLEMLTELKGKKRIIKTEKPVMWRVMGAEAQSVRDSLTTYADSLSPQRQQLLARYRVLDVGFKVVGVGSVGTRDYILYLEGNDASDPMFLQVKEEMCSAYELYVSGVSGVPSHQGRRVVEGARAMQLQSDPFLGWTTVDGRDFIVRQLNDHKARVELANLKPTMLPEYAAVCGELLARAHGRAGDCAVIAGYLGDSDRFDEAILKFAEAYADQTEHDWKKMVSTMKLGKAKS